MTVRPDSTPADGAATAPQTLPIEARWCLAPTKAVCIDLEVADTPGNSSSA